MQISNDGGLSGLTITIRCETNEERAAILAVLDLLPMDRACLKYLVECDGAAPLIPAKLFSGKIPPGYPSMTELGLIEDREETIFITDLGRAAVALSSEERS